MSGYTFSLVDVFAEPYAVAPQLTARLRIEEHGGQTIHAIVLRCQLRIEPQRRRYDLSEQEGLLGLFGDRGRWADTLRPFQWLQCSTTVPGFTGVTEVDIALPCTYDFDVVGSRYLHALGEGSVPLAMLFSGTVFTKGSTGFGVQPVPWDCEARYDMPVAVWRRMIDFYYPNSGWIRLDRDTLRSLADHRSRYGMTTWDETVESLLAARDEVVP